MAELNDQYLNSLKVALFQFARESSNFTSALSDVFNDIGKSTTQSSKQFDNTTKAVGGFGNAISSSSNYLKDFKTYVSNNSKNIAESSKVVKEYTSQLADLKQKSIDINRNWGALNNSLNNSVYATESAMRQHGLNMAGMADDLKAARANFYDELIKAGGNINDATKGARDVWLTLSAQYRDLKNLDVGKEQINAQIQRDNLELYKNIYDTFGNSLLTIDSLINEKTNTWAGLKNNIDELAKEAFKTTSLDISKEFQKNGIPGLHDYNKSLAEALIALQRTGGIIDASNYDILDRFQQFASKVGDSSDAVKSINDALNKHVKTISGDVAAGIAGVAPGEAKTTLNADIISKLTTSYEGNIDALDKFSKSINKTFTKHQIAFSTIIDKQLSEQSNIFGKFIYNFGRGAVQGGGEGSVRMEQALNEFTASMRAGLLPALKGIVETSKGFIKRETDAFADFIDLNRSSALQQQMGEEETIKLLSDTKPIWQTMEGGIGEFNDYQAGILETAKKTLGTNVEQRAIIEKANFENLRALGLLSHTVDKASNTEFLNSMMVDMQKITAAGGYSLQTQSELIGNVVKSSAVLKSMSMLDKDRKKAQLSEIENTIKFASMLKMTTEQATSVATALATMNTNMTRQQMVANVGSFMQMKTTLDMMGEKVGMSSGISDADFEKMSYLLQSKSNRPKDQEFIRDTMFNLVGKFKDIEMKYRSGMDEAMEKGDKNAAESYNQGLATLDDIITENIERFSGPTKEIIQKFAESYPTSKEEYAKIEATKKEGETFQQAMMRYVDTKANENITKQDTTTNNFEKSVTNFGNYVTAFGKNIFGANTENLFTVMFNGFANLAEIGILAKAAVKIFGTGGAAAGAGAAGAAGEAGLGALIAGSMPAILAALGTAAGVGMFAYGAKGLYDHFTGADVAYKADRGAAIHGMVDINNLDTYINQVTDSIDKQTQDILNGVGKTIIEQNIAALPTDKINNADISLALDDLKSFLTKELISGLMDNIIKISTNTGNTAYNTGDDGTLGKLVDNLKPQSQPLFRGKVETAETVTS